MAKTLDVMTWTVERLAMKFVFRLEYNTIDPSETCTY